jgi:pimeloyl-ACP methyl ester carboxylesterase
LALSALDQVTAPTLLIVGGMDMPVIEMNKTAYDELHCIKEMKIITGASHLFEEPGKLSEVADFAITWYKKNLIHKSSIIKFKDKLKKSLSRDFSYT